MKKAREKEAQRQLMLMRQKSYSNLFSSEEERNEYLMSLQTESKQGAALTLREIDILCSSLYPEDQEDCAICDDTRFSQLFLKHFDAGMNNYFLPQYEQQQLDDFVHDWRASIEKDDMSNDRIYIETRKETRYAMKCMKKDPAFQNLSPTLVEKKEKGILLRSKFLYIKIRKIIENIGSNELIVNLAGEEVHIDIFILIHTFSRHYSELTKQYNDNKSYFTPEIIGEQLPIILKEKILIPIEGSGVLGKDLPQSIFIKYFGQLYRITAVRYN